MILLNTYTKIICTYGRFDGDNLMTMDEMIEKLQNMVTPKRFRHSLAVRDAALQLSSKYGGDEEKAAVAGLVHDCAKGLADMEMLKLADEFGILIDSVHRTEINILHAPVGAMLARNEFGITDEEVFKAIRYHTTGCENMGLITKILYIADYIAEGRNFPEVEDLRKVAYINLDAAVLMGMDLTIQYVISKNGLVHPDTINARNYLILENSGIDYRNLF